MPSLQCRQLLAKNEILQKESTMSAEEAKDCTYQESDGICHAKGAIAFRLWRATFHEITSGHNFGEGQAFSSQPIAFATLSRTTFAER
jgi:hypothetical protein